VVEYVKSSYSCVAGCAVERSLISQLFNNFSTTFEGYIILYPN
jgi:hypothetical protein